jgi:hypothetical protein
MKVKAEDLGPRAAQPEEIERSFQIFERPEQHLFCT